MLLICTWVCNTPQAQARFAELNVARLEALQRATYAGFLPNPVKP
jgi:hypothetical protein